MTTILIAVILGMIAYIIKALIDINSLVLIITKDKEVVKIPNDFEKKYQFIKGLY
jgi:hypothetical protein